MMDYSSFKIKSQRDDEAANKRLHWFSSLFEKRLSFWLYRLGLSADTVTFLFGIVGILASFLIDNYLFLAYFLWRLHILLDMADGNIARATDNKSSRGIFLDILNHGLVNPLHIFWGCTSLLVGRYTTAIYLSSYLLFFLVKYLHWESAISKKNLGLNRNIFVILLKDLTFIEGLYVVLFFNKFGIIPNYIIWFYTLGVSVIYLIFAISELSKFYKN